MQAMYKDNRRLLVFIILSSFLLNLGAQVWQTLFNNFAVEDIGAGAGAVGLIQAVREVPGLLAFVIGFLALFMSETRIMSVSVILLGVGLLLSGQAHSVPFLVLTTLIFSIGFHFYMPCSNAVMLMITKESDTPKMLGSLGSLGSVAAVAGTLIVYIFAASLGYRNLFTWMGVVVILGGILLLPFGGSRQGLPLGRNITLRRRYWLYYTLSFLLGCRRHIFTTFAIYLLVREYHVSIQTTALLYLVNGAINVLTLRLTGQLVGRIGERMALTVTFASLALVFLGYAYVTVLPLLFCLFVLDNVFFGFNIALTTYFQKIAVTQEEITSNLSTEQTINHIAAIIVPLTGGAVWTAFGSQAVFLFGVAIVLAGLALTQYIRIAPRTQPVPITGA
jgi:predicted MFS family arabinose efflux permease